MRADCTAAAGVGSSGIVARVLSLITVALTVGLADSLNPSKVGPALYLAIGKKAVRRVAAFTLGVFAVSFCGGSFSRSAPGKPFSLLPRPGLHVTHLIELSVGIAVGLVAAGLWIGRHRVARHLARTEIPTRPLSFVVGAAIMGVAAHGVPYFAVILTILASGRGVSSQVALLAAFNVAFVAPLILIAGARGLRTTGHEGAGARAGCARSPRRRPDSHDPPCGGRRGCLDRHHRAIALIASREHQAPC